MVYLPPSEIDLLRAALRRGYLRFMASDISKAAGVSKWTTLRFLAGMRVRPESEDKLRETLGLPPRVGPDPTEGPR